MKDTVRWIAMSIYTIGASSLYKYAWQMHTCTRPGLIRVWRMISRQLGRRWVNGFCWQRAQWRVCCDPRMPACVQWDVQASGVSALMTSHVFRVNSPTACGTAGEPDWNVFSESELTFTFAICCRPSVCLSVVCNVRAPYSGGSNFWQYFYGIRYLGHPLTENFTEIVPGEPLRRGS